MKVENIRLGAAFFQRDTVSVAKELLGKIIVRRFSDGNVKRYQITETEAYCGQTDLACHSSKGRTKRTEVMFHEGGLVYIYFIYGNYWLLNFVTGGAADASAVLIRGIKGFNGPGKVGRELNLDRSFYGENIETSDRLWIEDAGDINNYTATPRIGIHYSGEPWVSREWRFIISTKM